MALITALPSVQMSFLSRAMSCLGALLAAMIIPHADAQGGPLNGWAHTGALLISASAAALLGYVLGALPFALWVPRLLGKGDPRNVGSGNLGATNVYRLAGFWCGVLVYALDAAKGALAALLCIFWPHGMPWVAGIFSILGHMFSPWVGFRGGKGVACASGVVLVMMPISALCAALFWLLARKLSPYASLASLGALLFFCVETVLVAPLRMWIPVGIIAALLVLSHRQNIVRVIKGEELPLRP